MRKIDNYFKYFIKEVGKYNLGIHQLYSGISLEEINKYEEKLGVEFPNIYKRFLINFNGGYLFVGPSEIILLSLSEDKYLEKCLLSEEEVLGWGLDKGNYLVISSECDGSLSVIDLNNSNKDKTVILNLQLGSEISLKWERLNDWLMYLLEYGSMLYNYDGTLKGELDLL
ncbi:SMI1/KNR4 family protein [Clostridium perfringens]|uniref:SMI1/KNR4 family protein n=1 Tax=Clostridium perfringens TaxID=1502 RepID=UPI0039EC7178